MQSTGEPRASPARQRNMISRKRPSSAIPAATLFCAVALATTACGSGSSGNDTKVPVTAYLTVTENYFAGASAASDPVPLKFTVTDRQTITRLAALINGLPTAPKQTVTPCPLQT